MLKDAANGCNPDTTSDKHRSSGDIFMQRERSSGTAHRELRAMRSSLQRGLKGSLAHAHRDHDWLFVMRRACERKGAGIIDFTSSARVREDKIGMLPGSEFEIGAICVEPERHRIFGNSLPIH